MCMDETFRGTPRHNKDLDATFAALPCGKNGEEYPSMEVTVGGIPPRELGEKVIQSFTNVSDNARNHLIVPADTGGYLGRGLRSTFARPRTFREICLTAEQLATAKKRFDRPLEKDTRKGAIFAEPGKSTEYREGELTLNDLRFIPDEFRVPGARNMDLFQTWSNANLSDAYQLERNSFETAAYFMLKERNRNILIPAVDPSSMGVFSVLNYPTGERHLGYTNNMDETYSSTHEVALLLRGRGELTLPNMYFQGWNFKDPKETIGQPRIFQQFLSGGW